MPERELGKSGLRVGILGCGALGGVMAARLADSEGIEIEVYNTNPEIAAAVEEHGLVLVDRGRRTVRRIQLLEAPQPHGRSGALLHVVILATKSVGLLPAARRLLPALAEHGVFVAVQNGLVALDLAQAFPGRVIAGAVMWGASMDAPGVYRITAHGPTLIGLPGPAAGADTDRPLQRAAAVLRRVFPVRVSDNMPGVLWSKLAITASFTTLGAITGLSFGELVRRRHIRTLLLGIGAEVLAAARAGGISLGPLSGALDMERLLSPEGYPPILKHLLIRVVGWKHRRTESGMLDSLRRGRKTEIEFINARVAALAGQAGVPCPLNRTATELVRELESGRLRPDIEHLKRFAVG